MYTGYSIRNQIIYRDEGETQFKLSGTHIHCISDEPTDCCLTQSLTDGVKHIYGPSGYTKFYVKEGHIYGPSAHLPWFDPCDEAQAVDTLIL